MKKKNLIIVGILILIIIAFSAYVFLRTGSKGIKYRMEKASIGNIRASVTATGKVNAVATVIVGAQTSGMIKALYVDFNSQVKKGQILAQIDPATFIAKVEQAKANLYLSQANLQKAEATLQDAKRTLARNDALFARNLIARSDLDTARTNTETSHAQVSASKAQVDQALASLRLAETDLAYATIRSPVNGMVISRTVDIGQTVAASFQTPTLFNIAQDLTKMQIETSVDEADIGRIQVGQPVEFTVDAFPELVFHGKVSEVRNSPTTIQNVVTYTVIVRVHNPEMKLRPGMTANVSIITDSKQGLLRVPSASLRFRMPETATAAKKDIPGGKGQQVWILDQEKPKKIFIQTGISDGSYTEVIGGALRIGQEVIIEAIDPGKKRENPGAAMPRFIR